MRPRNRPCEMRIGGTSRLRRAGLTAGKIRSCCSHAPTASISGACACSSDMSNVQVSYSDASEVACSACCLCLLFLLPSAPVLGLHHHQQHRRQRRHLTHLVEQGGLCIFPGSAGRKTLGRGLRVSVPGIAGLRLPGLKIPWMCRLLNWTQASLSQTAANPHRNLLKP